MRKGVQRHRRFTRPALLTVLPFHPVQVVADVHVDVRDGVPVETRLHVERVRFDVPNQRVGAIAL